MTKLDLEIPGYDIHRELGSGGMSMVYLATQKSFGRKVALKVLLPAFSSNQDFTARFIREAGIVSAFSHPHIVPVYDVGQHDEHHYMSMDYLAGGDLMQRLRSGLEPEEILQIAEDIASALHYAHQKGYIHRDIKPDNILFREDNSAVLTDFGIARLQNANDQVTQSGAVIGTPKYMAPEIMQGLDIDGRVDIYALGIVFYEMLMKQPPYLAEEYMALAMKHIEEPIPTLPSPYQRYQRFFEKCVAKKSVDRFQTGLEVVKAIQSLRQNENDSKHENEINTDSPKIEGELSADLEKGSVINKPASIPVKTKALNLESNLELSEKLKTVEKPKETTVFSEEVERKFLLKKYFFVCDMVVFDVHSFSVIFSSVSNKLLEWSEERAGKIGGFKLVLTANSFIFERAKAALEQLYASGGPYAFLQKSSLVFVMKNIDTGEEEIQTL